MSSFLKLCECALLNKQREYLVGDEGFSNRIQLLISILSPGRLKVHMVLLGALAGRNRGSSLVAAS